MTEKPLPSAVPSEWMPLQEAFKKLTDLLGKPRLALKALHGALLGGDVRSMRRRTLNDEGDTELSRRFWSDLELKFLAPNAPERKHIFPKARERDVIWLSPDPDKNLPEGIVAAGDVFYLHREGLYEQWPALAPPIDRTQKGSATSRKSEDAIREVLGRVYEDAKTAGTKIPNLNQVYPIVQPLVNKLGFSVSREDIRLVANEEKFRAMRLKRGQRPKRK
jgi:hypothetical protein